MIDYERWSRVMPRLLRDAYAVALLNVHWEQEASIRRHARRNGRCYVLLRLSWE